MLRGAGQRGAPLTARLATSALPRAGVAGSAVINTQIHPLVLRMSGAASTPCSPFQPHLVRSRQQDHGTQLLKWTSTAPGRQVCALNAVISGQLFSETGVHAGLVFSVCQTQKP